MRPVSPSSLQRVTLSLSQELVLSIRLQLVLPTRYPELLELLSRFFVEFTVIYPSAQPHLKLSAMEENAGS